MSAASYDCHAAAERLYDYLDGELTPEDTARVRAHLEVCAHCFGRFDFEAAFLRFLGARRRARGVPADLKRRILDQLLREPDPGTG